jgi:hypothetical protein
MGEEIAKVSCARESLPKKRKLDCSQLFFSLKYLEKERAWPKKVRPVPLAN